VQNTTTLQPNLFVTGYIAYWSQARTIGSQRETLKSSTTKSSGIINRRLEEKYGSELEGGE